MAWPARAAGPRLDRDPPRASAAKRKKDGRAGLGQEIKGNQVNQEGGQEIKGFL